MAQYDANADLKAIRDLVDKIFEKTGGGIESKAPNAGASGAVLEATADYQKDHPSDGENVPPAGGLRYAIDHGATPQQAADQAYYFTQNAVFPDGSVYGSGYNAWTRDHNSGEVDGFGWGLSGDQFRARYQTPAGGATPGFKPKDCGQGFRWNQGTKGCEAIPGFFNQVGSLLSK